MNSYKDIFLDYFSQYYYYDSSWRAYIEHYCWNKNGYSGTLGFFHFSHTDDKRTQFLNSKILKFIQQYHNQIYLELKKILLYSFKINAFISIVSYSENELVIKISQWDIYLRELISDVYFQHSWKKINFSHENYSCPIEIFMEQRPKPFLKYVWVCKKIDTPKNLIYIPWYLEEKNIFLVVVCEKYYCKALSEKKISYTVKLYESIPILESTFLKKNFYDIFLSEYFWEDIFVNSIYIGEEDYVFFTSGYIVEA